MGSEKLAVKDRQEILHIIDNYFQGIWEGDVAVLQSCFHPDTELFGEVRGQPYRKHLADYLDGVAARKSPQAAGEECRMRIVSIDVSHTVAMAKVSVPILGFNYVDYLSLVKLDEGWRIVSKVLSDVPA
ncbi:nuclear transport factor 2 family protein [Undibacterium terreum]|uniref:Lumazine-binding n=1 Tax=Undibacterium terreum TaxID=1224302 RepID=A0A916XK70_9BURK|nr:nuclear transport factor 2 family protein [Undibacterium terreum]GGC77567.1 hypothetical protein GCM10011396_25910 [Undibacterium terreum]